MGASQIDWLAWGQMHCFCAPLQRRKEERASNMARRLSPTTGRLWGPSWRPKRARTIESGGRLIQAGQVGAKRAEWAKLHRLIAHSHFHLSAKLPS